MLPYIVPLEYGVYGDLIIIYPKPYSIYLRGAIAVEESYGGVHAGPGAETTIAIDVKLSMINPKALEVLKLRV